MSAVSEDLKPKEVFHCRGGIERYIKTFPEGGYWRGKNYLFDRRMEQTPDVKNKELVENEVAAKCCVCRIKCTVYRGQFKCNRSLCRVPVIVCESCTNQATEKPETLICELCREGYKAPSAMPDLVSLKRKADETMDKLANDASCAESPRISKRELLVKKPKIYYNDRIFLRRVPLTASFQKIKEALGIEKVAALKWLTDQESGGFYGSCIVLLSNPECKRYILESKGGFKVDKKRIKVADVFMKGDESLFQNFIQMEYPPIGK